MERKFSMNALGIIETMGAVAAIETADAMRKVAHVTMAGQEEIGGGYVTNFVRGEVGAVKASVDAGTAAAKRLGALVASEVIARPHKQLDEIIPSENQAIIRSYRD